MPTTLNRAAFNKMLDEDIAWLKLIPGNDGPSTEKGHILQILNYIKGRGPEPLKAVDVSGLCGKLLFCEDDALVHDPSSEKMWKAFPRITGWPYVGRQPVEVIDCGDGQWEIYDNYVAYFSYAGNNYIYERKPLV